jgi:hypothetical protein
LYPEEQLLNVEFQLAMKTSMLDFAGEMHKKLHNTLPAGLMRRV